MGERLKHHTEHRLSVEFSIHISPAIPERAHSRNVVAFDIGSVEILDGIPSPAFRSAKNVVKTIISRPWEGIPG